ncbi:MAG: hypothetical protein LBT11_01310 [Treponema sp.]|jgi:hypothetical protein|nr:hypothetical protein [Treponema sp.]
MAEANKEKAVYAPGELSKVRQRLGPVDAEEAEWMVRSLGGEVGVERSGDPEPQKGRWQSRRQSHYAPLARGAGSWKPPAHRIELAPDPAEIAPEATKPRKPPSPEDNPSAPLKGSYRERVRMDRYAQDPEFGIKTRLQALRSAFSFFGPGPDYVSPSFVTRRLSEYYRQIEELVSATRTLFPRNNLARSEGLKRLSPFAFRILDTIRRWDIERINSDMARLQARPRKVLLTDLDNLLRAVYKPLIVLERLDQDAHIKGTYQLLYRALCSDNPNEPRGSYQELIRKALAAFALVRKDIRFQLYPLLLKRLSDRWLPCHEFFTARRNRLMAFLGLSRDDQIQPEAILAAAKPVAALATAPGAALGTALGTAPPGDSAAGAEFSELDQAMAEEEERARKAAGEQERRALNRSLVVLESLFPQAGWDRPETWPDLYPYFLDIFNLDRNYALIAPRDPLFQAMMLVTALDELFFGLRSVSFEAQENLLAPIINDWHYHIETGLEKEYLSRLSEYCRILENSPETRNSPYVRRLLSDLRWIKKLFFFPYYQFEPAFPAPFRKKDVHALYPDVRQLRLRLTTVAAGIEQGKRQGGAAAQAHCEGIQNPWEPYRFQIPNPLSTRLDALLEGRPRNNAALIYYTLAITVALDYLLNSNGSWAYTGEGTDFLFRSVRDEGTTPLTGVDAKIDAAQLFQQSLKARAGS